MRVYCSFIAAMLILGAIASSALGQANPGVSGAPPAAGGGPAGVAGVGPRSGNGAVGITGAGPLYGNGLAGVSGVGPGQAPRPQMNIPSPPTVFVPNMSAIEQGSPTSVNSFQGPAAQRVGISTVPTVSNTPSATGGFQTSPAFGTQFGAAGTVNRSVFTPTTPGQGSPTPTATMNMYSGSEVGAGVNIGTSNAGASGTLAPSGAVNSPPGAMASQLQLNTPSRSNQNPNAWRVVNQNGQWWYWTPSNFWMYYRAGAWQRYNPDIGLAPAPQRQPQ